MKAAFDLHLHSCLSPCGDSAMTPATIAGMCRLAGLDVAALTDHNSTGNCAAFCEAARRYGLLGIPGMELCTVEEVHVVCLLPSLVAAAAFGAEVYRSLPDCDNNRKVFGPQIYMDVEDRILGEEKRMLAAASAIGIYEVPALMEKYGGVAYPAHVDRPAFSLLSNLGLWDPDLRFPLAELSRNCPEHFVENRPDLMGVPTIMASDAHYIEQITDASQWMEIPRLEASSVLAWLKNLKIEQCSRLRNPKS
jgi:PHP family Zn ribbon phosphoesterase